MSSAWSGLCMTVLWPVLILSWGQQSQTGWQLQLHTGPVRVRGWGQCNICTQTNSEFYLIFDCEIYEEGKKFKCLLNDCALYSSPELPNQFSIIFLSRLKRSKWNPYLRNNWCFVIEFKEKYYYVIFWLQIQECNGQKLALYSTYITIPQPTNK